MKRKRRRLCALVLGITVLFAGCKDGGLLDDVSGFFAKVDLSNPKALFLGIEELVGELFKKLYQITADGFLQEVSFYDDKDVKITDVEVTNLIRIDSKYSGLDIISGGEESRLLIRHSDGALFDFTQYPLEGSIVEGNYIYSLNPDTNILYKIDMAALEATALNNPDFNLIYPGSSYSAYLFWPHWYTLDETGLSGFYHDYLMVNDGILLVYGSNGTGAQWGYWLFFSDNSIPVFLEDDLAGNLGGINMTYNGSSYNGLGQFVAPNGHFYRVAYHSVLPTVLSKFTFGQSGYSEDVSSLLEDPQSFGSRFTPWTNYQITDYERYIIFEYGFYKTTADSNGALQITWTDKSFPALPNGNPDQEHTKLTDSYLYWNEGDTIKRMLIEGASSPETIVTDSNIVRWYLVGNAVIYVKQVSATASATYRARPGRPTEFVSESDMEIQSIVKIN